jgi:peptide/nickel transport system substrate-binding protein
MRENPIVALNRLYLQFRDGTLDRRQFMLRASALGLSAASLSRFFSVLPANAARATKSTTRAEWQAKLAESFPFTADPGAESDGGTVTIGRLPNSGITTLNLLLANDSPTQSVLNLCQEYLVAISPVDGQFVPGLADSWEIADDRRTYTFNLNRQARWHDGQPFTANDVVFSFDAQSREETGTQFQASFTNAVESYRKVDSNTVEVVAKDVFAPIVFLGNTLTAIVPKHVWRDIPFEDWATDPGSTGEDPSRVIGTGPFKFASRSASGDEVTFTRHEAYYDAVPIIETLTFRTLPDPDEASNALAHGEIDVYERPPVDQLAGFEDDDQFQVTVYDTFSFVWYGTNLDPQKTDLFQDVNVRRALLYGLDREAMVRTIMRGFAEVAQGTQPLLSSAYDPDQITTHYDYDPDRAAQLLNASGWRPNDDGILEKDGDPFSFSIQYAEDSSQVEQAVTAMQAYWAEIGIDAKPEPVNYQSDLIPALTETFDFEMVALAFTWDATGDQLPMFGSEYKGVGYNAVGYANPDYDEVADQANRATDNLERQDRLIEASNIVNDDLPIGILWFRRDGTASNARLHNFVANGRSAFWSLPWVWVE